MTLGSTFSRIPTSRYHLLPVRNMRDGRLVIMRPLRLADIPLLVDFQASLSAESVVKRYFAPISLHQRTSTAWLAEACCADENQLTLAAILPTTWLNPRCVAATARLTNLYTDPTAAEFSLLVADPFQGRGLGRLLLQRLIFVGQQRGLRRLVSLIMAENRAMLHLCAQFGFATRLQDDMIEASLQI